MLRFYRPKGRLGGFQANAPAHAPLAGCITEIGELWTPADWIIGPHANKGWELFLQTKGSSAWRAGQARFAVPQGGFYLVAPGIVHQLERLEAGTVHFFYVVFQPERLLNTRERKALTAAWPARAASGMGAGALEAPFRCLIRELASTDAHKETAMRTHLAALCIELARVLTRPPRPEAALRAHPAAVRARDLLEAQPEQAWQLEDLAAAAGVSAPHLIELFRRDFAETPARYLTRLRVNRARALLQGTDRRVADVAAETGFCSGQHLAGTLRRVLGMTASEVRGKKAGPSRGAGVTGARP